MNDRRPSRIGVISDTHGLVRPEVPRALAGAGRILHAGDVDEPGVLRRLEEIAPVTAVRGNVDHGEFGRTLSVSEVVEVESLLFYMVHDRLDVDLDPAAAGFHCVISGHSHRPALEARDGVVYLNPGSAGPRRFDLPVSLALLEAAGRSLTVVSLRIDPERGRVRVAGRRRFDFPLDAS
jgi:hypothetical protein